MKTETLGVAGRVAGWSAERPVLAVTGWVAAVAAAVVVSQTVGLRFQDKVDVPGTESQRAMEVLERSFPQRQASATVILAATQGAPDPAFTESVLSAVRAVPHVRTVGTPMPSADGRALMASVEFDRPAGELKASIDELTALRSRAIPGVELAFGGDAVSLNQEPEPGKAELIGLGIALVTMLLVFRSLVATLLPLLTAIAASTVGIVLVGLIGWKIEVSSAAPMLASMLGLGVGIDYALFFITRARQEGGDWKRALSEAARHSGRAILFAGICVVVALCGIVFTGVTLLIALGLAAALVVALSVLAALTLLPALIALTHRWVIEVAPSRREGNAFSVLAKRIVRRPVVAVLTASGVLLAVAAPVFDLELGFPDDGAQPAGSSARRAYELTAEHYGPGLTGPLVLAIEATDAAEVGARLVANLTDPEIAAVLPPVVAPDGTASTIVVVPRHTPQANEVVALVERLRAKILPAFVKRGERVSVGGTIALTIDVSKQIEATLPAVIGVVLGATFLLLLFVFRSVLVPLKAVLMNLLSVAAAYGVLVMVFQWGWGRSWVGLDHFIPIVSILPLLLFALLFGLSMDYEVFLLARVREEHERGHDAAESVSLALAATGRVVSSAAAIMVAVFVAFALGPDPVVKMFGVGLAAAIFLDATIIRLVLVPATMVLLGPLNWWLPRPLERWLPRVRVE